MDSVGALNLQVPENLNRLPENFPDESSFELLDYDELSESERNKIEQMRIKMSSVYTIWKKICLAWRI